MRYVSEHVEKEANRFYWMVKGMLIPDHWSDKDVIGIYDSYIRRLWGNHEASPVHETGFEEAYTKRERERRRARGVSRNVSKPT